MDSKTNPYLIWRDRMIEQLIDEMMTPYEKMGEVVEEVQVMGHSVCLIDLHDQN